jgi:hypothetical protein
MSRSAAEYREEAAACIAMAGRISDPEARTAFLGIAAAYERLAAWREHQEADGKRP